MARVTHVLGRNFREANAYGAEFGVETVFVTTPAQLRSASRIVVLPSFETRRDRMVLAAALRSVERYARNGLKVERPDWVWDEPKPAAVEIPGAEATGITADTAVDVLEELAKRRGMTMEDLVERIFVDKSQEPTIPWPHPDPEPKPEPKPEPPPRPKGPATKSQPKRASNRPPVVTHPDF